MSSRPSQSNICIVCLESITDTSGKVTTSCGHTYCVTCFAQHMRVDNRCGYCRTELAPLPTKQRETLDIVHRNNMTNMVMDNFINNGGVSAMYTDINNQVRQHINQVYGVANGRVTRTTERAIDITMEAVRNVDLNVDLWMLVSNAIDSTVNWFDESIPDSVEDDATVVYDDSSDNEDPPDEWRNDAPLIEPNQNMLLYGDLSIIEFVDGLVMNVSDIEDLPDGWPRDLPWPEHVLDEL